MATRLAWEGVEAMVAEERRRADLDVPVAERDDEAMRLIAALWEWAVSREPSSSHTAAAG
jgi:hypothetical protein